MAESVSACAKARPALPRRALRSVRYTRSIQETDLEY